MKPTIHFHCKPFSELTLLDWYNISQAREQVFIVEQNCPYLDSDGQDLRAWHVIGYAEKTGELACYARILLPTPRLTIGKLAGLNLPAIGRVLTVEKYRGFGLAGQLMEFAITQSREKFGYVPIYISAQVYLLNFYQSLGFITQGEPYLEDNIPHQDMVLLSN